MKDIKIFIEASRDERKKWFAWNCDKLSDAFSELAFHGSSHCKVLMIQIFLSDQHECFFELFSIIFRLSSNIKWINKARVFMGEPDWFICNKLQNRFDTSVMYQKDLQKS